MLNWYIQYVPMTLQVNEDNRRDFSSGSETRKNGKSHSLNYTSIHMPFPRKEARVLTLLVMLHLCALIPVEFPSKLLFLSTEVMIIQLLQISGEIIFASTLHSCLILCAVRCCPKVQSKFHWFKGIRRRFQNMKSKYESIYIWLGFSKLTVKNLLKKVKSNVYDINDTKWFRDWMNLYELSIFSISNSFNVHETKYAFGKKYSSRLLL